MFNNLEVCNDEADLSIFPQKLHKQFNNVIKRQ